MAVWWITEALPLPATALVPVVAFPFLGIADFETAAMPYADPLIFLFLGGFIIARGMQRWELHRRMALHIIRWVGTEPSSIILGFMLASAFLSMWVSNTATAMMMLPIGLSVIQLVPDDQGSAAGRQAFSVALLLGIAYACSVGGLGTLIGTPPNALLAGYMQQTYGVQIGFARWMMVGVPVAAVGLVVVYGVLTRLAFPQTLSQLAASDAVIDDALDALGSMQRPEKMVAAVFATVAVLWMARPALGAYAGGLTDGGIAMAGALALFVLPVDRKGTFVLDWSTAADLPWGVLLLFGGGLALATSIDQTGLARWLGQRFIGLEAWPTVLVVLVVVAALILLTELTSNTATAAVFIPLLGSVAVGIGENPLVLAVPVALAASCAFMLPVATPPNAIVYGSNRLDVRDMMRAGAWLNALFVLLITLVVFAVLPWALNVRLGTVPSWAF